ncbi:MAG: tetratricopeptide repeat protein [Proteobacteria bacterium]|nr:tetratricopeptide repeat protein [Pseudomonadota bacterium]MBU1686116.1 tetratricopeptide repeat protein [Pseudomonadota bacterium]
MRKYCSQIFIVIFSCSLLITSSYAVTIEDYNKAIKGSSTEGLPRLYMMRGKFLKNTGKSSEAIEDYSHAILLRPSLPAYMERGKIYYEKKHYSGAIRDFTEALKIDTTQAEALFLRGSSYKETGDYPAALRDGTLLIQTSPKDITGYQLQTDTLFAQKNLEEASDVIVLAFKNIGETSDTLQLQETFEKEQIKLKGAPKIVMEGAPKPLPVKPVSVEEKKGKGKKVKEKKVKGETEKKKNEDRTPDWGTAEGQKRWESLKKAGYHKKCFQDNLFYWAPGPNIKWFKTQAEADKFNKNCMQVQSYLAWEKKQ